jgi:2-methylfumaryl-CoA hydratase
VSKTNAGNFFEDFQIGQVIKHATPRTITSGDQALYTALYGSRFAVQSSDAFARALGYAHAPVDDLLTFHVVFGKTVPDISLNAVANLGYAGGRFLAPVYPGDTLSTVSEVIGKKENSNGKTGVVYVRSTGYSDDGTEVLDYVRWVMVKSVMWQAHPPMLLCRTCPPPSILKHSATPSRCLIPCTGKTIYPAHLSAGPITKPAKKSTTSTE